VVKFYKHAKRLEVASHHGGGIDQDYTVRIFLTLCKDGSVSIRGHVQGLHGNRFPKGVRGIRNAEQLYDAIREVGEEVGILREIDVVDICQQLDPHHPALARGLSRLFLGEEDA
jgi:hypothetical protein